MPEQVDGSTTAAVPLSELERDLPAPAGGWAAELGRRGVAVVLDDLGRAAVDRATARALFAEHRENEVRMARHRAEVERLAVEASEACLASIPRGVPVHATPMATSAVESMMLADPPDRGVQRESVLEHALARRDGGVLYPIQGEAP